MGLSVLGTRDAAWMQVALGVCPGSVLCSGMHGPDEDKNWGASKRDCTEKQVKYGLVVNLEGIEGQQPDG